MRISCPYCACELCDYCGFPMATLAEAQALEAVAPLSFRATTLRCENDIPISPCLRDFPAVVLRVIEDGIAVGRRQSEARKKAHANVGIA